MNVASTAASTFTPWTDEPSARANRRKVRARIGGLHCSLCTGTIEKALGRSPGVDKVAVSLTHEQALVEYDPAVARPEQFLQTLRDIGYTISDPRKLRLSLSQIKSVRIDGAGLQTRADLRFAHGTE